MSQSVSKECWAGSVLTIAWVWSARQNRGRVAELKADFHVRCERGAAAFRSGLGSALAFTLEIGLGLGGGLSLLHYLILTKERCFT